MRSLFHIACASLFLAGVVVSAITEETMTTTSTIEASTVDNNELNYIDIESQSRRKNWDVLGVLLMMVNSECGPGGDVHIPDCHLLHSCKAGNSADCTKLCNKKSDHGKSKYSKFCSGDGSGSSSSSNTSVDSYVDNSTPGNVVSDGRQSAKFGFWMIAVAGSVGMALVAVHIGQRKDPFGNRDDDDNTSLAGGEVRGSVGRRVGVVSDLFNGVLGRRGNKKEQVELAEYQLEDPPPSYPQSSMV